MGAAAAAGGTGRGGASNGGSTGAAAGAASGGGTAPRQTSHRPYIDSYIGQVNAVQDDVRRGSGRSISTEEAKKMLDSIHTFSGEGYKKVRAAYNNPNADSNYAGQMKSIDDYIHSAPKWQGGRVYRGINVTKEKAAEIMSGKPIDMLGPSSWSSDQTVAERFSLGKDDVRIVFVMDDNKSGASITHIGSWNGAESEVTAPSGVKYQYDGASKSVKTKVSDIIYIDVHE